jgi:large subunit ribosomal protein L4
MAQVTMKNISGKDAASVSLADDVFGITPNVAVMHQVVTAQLAHRRAGTQKTKGRSEVSGGGSKPFSQKGTGNARQGSTRAPHFSGGAVTLGPTPRKYSQRTPKKMVQLALRSALSDRFRAGKVIVVDSWSFDTASTKKAAAALEALGASGKVLVVTAGNERVAEQSLRNLESVQLVRTGELNAYDVLCNDVIVFSQASLPGASKGDDK